MALLRSQSHKADYLVAGLGNPGPGSEHTRHNVGYLVVGELARRHGFPRARRGYDGRCASGAIAGRAVLLLQPTTYMNASGKSVAALEWTRPRSTFLRVLSLPRSMMTL